MCPRKAIISTFTQILWSESTDFLALSCKNHPASNTSLSEQNHIIPQSQTGHFSWSGCCSLVTPFRRKCQSWFCCKKHPVTKQNIILFFKKKKKLSLLLSAVFLWVSFRAAFPLDSFRLESRTKTIKYEGVDTTFDLETP